MGSVLTIININVNRGSDMTRSPRKLSLLPYIRYFNQPKPSHTTHDPFI